MRRALLLAALVLAGAGVGAATVATSGVLADNEPVEVITVRGETPAEPGRLVAEDGIARADAERLADAATRAVPGTALAVERDDGLFEVEIRERDGGHREVLLDDDFAVVGTDGDQD
jgi:hypothetical protein